MYNCNPNYVSYDYTACYIQSFPGRNYINCILPYEYTYNNMTGTLTCAVSSDGSASFSDGTNSGSCSFRDAETNNVYYFDKNQ